jgi:hypothetical protein
LLQPSAAAFGAELPPLECDEDLAEATIMDTHRRVKVYLLDDKDQWEDKGTGVVSLPEQTVCYQCIPKIGSLKLENN